MTLSSRVRNVLPRRWPLAPWRRAVAGAILLAHPGAAVAASDMSHLSLAEAEAIALGDEPTLNRLSAEAERLDSLAIAEAELPDPKLSIGVMNLPVDEFRWSREPMAQVRAGLSQAFPPGSTLTLRGQRMSSLADAERADREATALRLHRDVRLAWLEVHYGTQAEAIVAEAAHVFESLIGFTESAFATGRGNQQDLIQAELELGFIRDRATEVAAALEAARADLGQWVGPAAAARPLPPELPNLSLPLPEAEVVALLPTHPLVGVEDRRISAHQTEIDIAEEQYKPAWSLDVSYGFRSGDDPLRGERPDLLSVMANLTLPLFTADRQDQRLAASKSDAAAALFARDTVLRDLRRETEAAFAAWRRLREREALFEDELLGQSTANVEAALHAYQADVADFTTVIRAELGTLEARLSLARIKADRLKAAARILYLQGGA